MELLHGSVPQSVWFICVANTKMETRTRHGFNSEAKKKSARIRKGLIIEMHSRNGFIESLDGRTGRRRRTTTNAMANDLLKYATAAL